MDVAKTVMHQESIISEESTSAKLPRWFHLRDVMSLVDMLFLEWDSHTFYKMADSVC